MINSSSSLSNIKNATRAQFNIDERPVSRYSLMVGIDWQSTNDNSEDKKNATEFKCSKNEVKKSILLSVGQVSTSKIISSVLNCIGD